MMDGTQPGSVLPLPPIFHTAPGAGSNGIVTPEWQKNVHVGSAMKCIPVQLENRSVSLLPENETLVSSSVAYSSGVSFFDPEKDWSRFGAEIDEMALQAFSGHQAMPCMKETADTMLATIQVFLSCDFLPQKDREALEKYQVDIQKLEGEGFPYENSLQLALLFPLVQDMYYAQAFDTYLQKRRKRSKKPICIV